MKLKDRPIQRKLLHVILLCCAVVVFLMTTGYAIFEYFSFRKNLKGQVLTLASITAANSAGTLAFDVPKEGYEILNSLQAEKHIVAACLFDEEGNLFAKYPADIATAGLPSKHGADGLYFHNGYLQGFVPVTQSKDRIGTLFIKSDMKAMYSQLGKYGVLAISLFVFSLVVAFLLSRILRNTITQPILSLEETAKIISEKRDYSVRATRSASDEVGSLTDAFNQMLTQIELQNSQITAFTINLEQKVRERTNELESANIYLKQQNDFVETIIDSSVHLISVLDKNLRFSAVNRRCEELYKMPKSKIIGRAFLEVFPQNEDSENLVNLRRALQGDYVHTLPTRSRIIDAYFETYFVPLKQNDEVYGVLVMAHDISDIMAANEKLKDMNSELEKSNRDLEQFAFVASHDLLEPLRKIHIFNDLLAENMDDREAMQKYQAKIGQSAKRMQDLITDVLNFSRISKTEEAFSETDLNNVMENLKSDFELMINEKEATINYDVLPQVPGIPLQLSQLLSNLISNSLKYCLKKPVISITSKTLSRNEIKENKKLNESLSYTQINFSDNGIGFEAKYREQIFTIFQRLHGKQAYSGTGIGLALCRKIVENHHGIITADSEPGEGALFTIILPLSVELLNI